jgi:hypothetical protein
MQNHEMPKCEIETWNFGDWYLKHKEILTTGLPKCETRFGSTYGHSRWSHQWKMGEGASANKLLFSEFQGLRLGSVKNAHIKDVERRNRESTLRLSAWS